MKDGFYNEFEFINELNNKQYSELKDKFKKLIGNIYGNSIYTKISCYKSFKTDKTDFVIVVNDIKKNISLKNGKNNSVHMEHINAFISFLQENKVKKKYIDIYKNYHYASDKFGNRTSANEYKLDHKKEICKFNNYINRHRRLVYKFIYRCLFKGIHKENNIVDYVIYGTVDNFFWLSRDQILKYLINYKDIFTSIHFSALVLQPWTRNLNYNEKYEYRRDYVQVKWYRLEEKINDILNLDS